MNEKPLQVLLVEDSAGDVSLIRAMLVREGPASFELTHMVFMGEAEVHLAKGGVDVVLLDMGLPDAHGLDSLRRARAAAPGIPLIVMTGLEDEELAAEAMAEGAQDYMIKGQIESRALPRALRHAIERQRMQTETNLFWKNQAQFKEEFLSHVSHELRSPLTAIKQFTSILAGGLAGELNKEQREYLQIVLKNIGQLQSMIDDLLEVPRLKTGKLTIELERVSVANAVADCCNTFQGSALAKGVTLSYDLPSDLPSAHADQTRLRQILIILLDNAIKFTPSGGSVKIQVQVLPQDPGFLLLEISDTGCGMSPEMTGRVFERLYQAPGPAPASRKGLGLGLFICKELVILQGGQISVKSQVDVGSTFSFMLPVFSLSNSIAPLFHNGRWPADSVALVMVKTCFLDASKESQEEESQQVRSLVERCLMPNLDVLLPKMSYGAEGERFFVAAFANEKGASILVNRIRDQFKRLLQPKRTGLTLSVSHTMLRPFPADVGASTEDRVISMARNLEQSIQSQSLSEASFHE
jgi:signal transduction histidine kinase